MSKISPMQAAALGLKPNVSKTNSIKPAVAKPAPKPAAAKPTVAKPAAAKPSIKPAVAKKPATKKPAITKAVTKPVAKPAPKPSLKAAVKPASKPKASNIKKDKKNDKKAKPEKVKMERDSFTMPKDEYAQLTLLKARLTSMGQPAKKSELLRAGIKLLAAMSDNTLKTTLAKIPVIKTGRPTK